jgi:hypothetical protein
MIQSLLSEILRIHRAIGACFGVLGFRVRVKKLGFGDFVVKRPGNLPGVFRTDMALPSPRYGRAG